MSRISYDVTEGRPIQDIAATVFALLGTPAPPSIVGTAFPLGMMMEPPKEVNITVVEEK